MTGLVKSQGDIVIFGRQRDIKLAILQAISAQRQIWNKDVGQIVGMPTEDLPRAKHMDRKLVVLFKSVEKPPWRINGINPKSVDYSIPDCKQGLTYEQIKEICRAFTWGKFRCTAFLDNARQMAVYAASKEEAEEVMQRLVTLSTAQIIRLSVTEEIKVNVNQIKIATRVYPCYATLVTEPTDILGVPVGGKQAYKRRRRRLDLYRQPTDLSPLG
ncbi:hypothetical protein [Nostoc punctiforme]|uniref:Uncharacterized protein n=1 Tax=Nostoc punctiforme (strain ATCC 29133 / PCC 73102) TaxID=63737 RepID=B2J1I3_NOSP7|nr:hypothetical protein [Nostoc punctiforme]ACC80344.1 hypothetical protein Npun_F1672 [Nostoc punctiforme PCC 73102]